MATIRKFHESAGAPAFRRITRQEVPPLPFEDMNRLEARRTVKCRDGTSHLILVKSGVYGSSAGPDRAEVETWSWRRCRPVLDLMVSQMLARAPGYGKFDLGVYYFDAEDAAGVAPDDLVTVSDWGDLRCKLERIWWNETGGSKGRRLLDAAAGRMSDREIAKLVVNLNHYTSGDHHAFHLHFLPDDWAYLYRSTDLLSAQKATKASDPLSRYRYHHYLCDAAMGGVEGAIVDSQHG